MNTFQRPKRLLTQYPNSVLLLSGMVLIALFIAATTAAHSQSFLPLQPGMGVVTCGTITLNSLSNRNFVVGVVDFRTPPANAVGVNWNAPMYHGPNDSWTDQNLGQVFGVCLDSRGHIYVTATTSYGVSSNAYMVGPGGPGAIYKLDGRTGEISTFAVLPNSGPGLGNICFDRYTNQFFVSNVEDGRLYRLSDKGAVLEAFDPYTPDDGTPGFAPRGERPWGVCVYGGRLYYSIWSTGYLNLLQGDKNEIRSVGIDKYDGSFKQDDRLEYPVIPFEFYPGSCPVSDIVFSTTGRMLLAERSMSGDDRPAAHRSRVLEYGRVGGVWTFVQLFQIGNYGGISPLGRYNSSGGVDFGIADDGSLVPDQVIWATGDALRFPGYNPDSKLDFIYGLTRIPPSGNTVANVGTTSYFIDLDGDIRNTPKTQIGDVAVVQPGCFPEPIEVAANKYAAEIRPTLVDGEARLSVSLAFDGHIRADLLTPLGQEAAMVADAWRPAGTHQLEWNSAGLPPGSYFVRVRIDHWSCLIPVHILR